MSETENIKPTGISFKKYVWIIVIIWTAGLSASLIWNLLKARQDTLEMAVIHARESYKKDIIYRRWAAMHGGVYVPVTEETQPNPYLSEIPERDIMTPSGKMLTLMNPAYMTREVFELADKEHDAHGHITSLRPINPKNVPDSWEAGALRAFERGEKEVASVEFIEGEEVMRLMRPLITTKECLTCHAKQGYKAGDVRGGISVSVHMKSLRKTERMTGSRLALFHAGIWITGLFGIVLSSARLTRSEKKRQLAEADLRKKQSDMMVLNNISSTISSTIDIDELLSIILHTVTEFDIFDVERKGGILIVEGDKMKLVSHLGHPEGFLDLHKNIKVGDCLCGLAVRTGEIIISKNSEHDSRHTVKYRGMAPHGHIIVPLKAKDKVVGVLYLYLKADFDIEDEKINLLASIGNQLGIAIDNARLYEETKRLSLHDPLTGLANRRFMEIVMSRNFAHARRVGEHFSIIMLDLDHFKKYNDTYGHTAGDKLLTDLGDLIRGDIREIDLAVRYGGEEFLILLPETEPSQAHEIAERIRSAVEEKLGATISLGITSYTAGVQTEKELIDKADKALYQAKHKGRNRTEII
ncbi:MAG: diguanylate cyclase [Nitrospirae bacterium]|nr:diguanylate cyclase [Nitrospirota bacterium]